MDICLRIKEKERVGNAVIVVIDDCVDHEGHCSCEKDRQNEAKFWGLIGGTRKTFLPRTASQWSVKTLKRSVKR